MNTHSMRGGTVYANTARFDTGRALTEDELYQLAPSVFATEAHESRSDRFVPIPTITAVRALAKEGFSVVGAKQSLTRVEGKAPFTKHALRMRRLDDEKKYAVGDVVFEVILKNANDGTAAYDLMAGLWRIACLNSLVTKSASLGDVRVRHTGHAVVDNVIEGTYRVLGESERLLGVSETWGAIPLDADERTALANAAHILRFADHEGTIKTPVEPEQMLRVRRTEDRQNSLWQVWNRIQENAIKGGLTATGRDANNRPRQVTTRPVKGIDGEIKLNCALFTLGEEMARLKGLSRAA